MGLRPLGLESKKKIGTVPGEDSTATGVEDGKSQREAEAERVCRGSLARGALPTPRPRLPPGEARTPSRRLHPRRVRSLRGCGHSDCLLAPPWATSRREAQERGAEVEGRLAGAAGQSEVRSPPASGGAVLVGGIGQEELSDPLRPGDSIAMRTHLCFCNRRWRVNPPYRWLL